MRAVDAGLPFCLLLTGTVTAHSQTSGRNDLKIAYNLLWDEEADDYEVFVMNLDGTERTNITRHPAVDWAYYAWKDKLYFVSDRDNPKRKYHLYEMGWDGSDIRQVR